LIPKKCVRLVWRDNTIYFTSDGIEQHLSFTFT
jgi:hypothetical protein